MPTPFTHLEITLRLANDLSVPAELREFIAHYQADFLLGGIIADQRPDGGSRADTHFYEYTQPMPDHPWREMFRQHPSLKHPKSDAHQAFLLSYVAHLAADEYWSLYMLKPNFAEAGWSDGIRGRFYMLHLLLITMDERDELLLPEGIGAVMQNSEPNDWLPFLSDDLIRNWRDFLAQQIDEHDSQTLRIFGGRIKTSADDVRVLLDDEEYMTSKLWNHVSHETLAEVERDLYQFAREQLVVYWEETQQ